MNNSGVPGLHARPRPIYVVLVASFALNAWLGVWLLFPLSPRGAAHPPKFERIERVNFPKRTGDPALATATDHTDATPALFKFNWRQIESRDYRQYVANLRAVGCPEQTVRDILMADLNQLYATRLHGTGPEIREYWQKGTSQSGPQEGLTLRGQVLMQEKKSVAQEIIGAPVRGNELVLLLGVDMARVEVAFLPEDKREAAYRALEELSDSRSRRPENDIEQDKESEVAVLSQILSTEELEEYRMRTSPTAASLRSELPYFDSTPEEFKALVNLRDERAKQNIGSPNPYARLPEEAEAFGQLFGEERGREYAEKADLFYLWARQATERFGLEASAADEAWNIKRDAITTVQQLQADTTLSAEESRQKLEALHSATESRLVQILGPKGLEMARRGDWWLQNPTLKFGP